MTQNLDVLNHLRKNKSLTPFEALTRYGCFRLGARIWDLRRDGHVINRTLGQRGRKRWAIYSLVKEARR